MTSERYNEIIRFLETRNVFHSVDYLKTALERLKLEINPAKVILVAGTNGKGIVCATLQTLLCEAGKSVGLFTSPHLKRINERIKFNGVDIVDDEFCCLFEDVHPLVSEYNLTYFEYLTFMAVYYFFGWRKNETDFAIFEVGLGGTQDSTNAIPHSISVVAKLGMDHEDILGNSICKIARDKFGIIAEGNMVFHLNFPSETEDESIPYRKIAKFIRAYECSMRVDVSEKYPTFFILTSLGEYEMPLPGRRAMENIALALTVFDYLIPNAAQYAHAVSRVRWPGRMEKAIYNGREIFLSGDHNPQGIESLLELLVYYRYAKMHFVVGIRSDKDHCEMLDQLANFPNAVLYLTETTVKAVPIRQYDEKFLKMARCAAADPIDAINAAIANAAPADMIVVTGSLYLVGLYKRKCDGE
jgi:dihydrofolate synthase/folylpolyglutamate synthase